MCDEQSFSFWYGVLYISGGDIKLAPLAAGMYLACANLRNFQRNSSVGWFCRLSARFG